MHACMRLRARDRKHLNIYLRAHKCEAILNTIADRCCLCAQGEKKLISDPF